MEGRCAETTNLSLSLVQLGRGGSASDISFDDFRASWVICWVPIGSTSTSVPEQLLKDGRKFRIRAVHTNKGLGKSHKEWGLIELGEGKAGGSVRTGVCQEDFPVGKTRGTSFDVSAGSLEVM